MNTEKQMTHVPRINNIFDTNQGIELVKQFYLGHSTNEHFSCDNEICLTTTIELVKL